MCVRVRTYIIRRGLIVIFRILWFEYYSKYYHNIAEESKVTSAMFILDSILNNNHFVFYCAVNIFLNRFIYVQVHIYERHEETNNNRVWKGWKYSCGKIKL